MTQAHFGPQRSLRVTCAAWVAALIGLAVLVACGSVAEAPKSTSAKAEPRLSAMPKVQHPKENPESAAKAALGAQLFLDKRLSGSGTMSCQGCHYRQLGWTDGQVFSRRDNGETNARHTPSLYNVGHQSIWYWDGRAATLEAQIVAAWRNQMSVDPAKAAERINAVPAYATQFQALFGGVATPGNISQSLAAYLRTKNSEDSPWDRFEAGNPSAVSNDAKAGFALFMGQGRCVTCHNPPRYGSDTFFNIGLEGGKAKPDAGRGGITKIDSDIGAFKTPGLRSVALGGPYFHDGSGKTLEDAVRYMANGGGNDPRKSPLITPTGLSDVQIKQVVAFLETLTSTEKWEPVKVP